MVREIEAIDNVRIKFPNFSGISSTFNQEGKRNFCVVIDSELATDLQNKGYNIRILRSREEEDEPEYLLPVSINFDHPRHKPNVYLITKRGKRMLNEETINRLDSDEIESVDLRVVPYEWSPGRKKAYVKSMAVEILEDDLQARYEIIPDAEQHIFGEDER